MAAAPKLVTLAMGVKVIGHRAVRRQVTHFEGGRRIRDLADQEVVCGRVGDLVVEDPVARPQSGRSKRRRASMSM